ncbi:MAG TPA: hypothetical protein DCK87_06185 [Desulfotomaculum sp.]|nr:hypothetical protein [Desulfotomaculum sp.]
MRKVTSVLLILFLFVFIVSIYTIPTAASPSVKAIFTVGQSSYTVDGQVRQMDAKAFIENGRTYVPIRYLALAMGVAEKDIIWNNPNVILNLNNVELKLTVNSKTLYTNNQPKQMDVSVVNRNGRTYLPARWVAEAFGYEVKWQPPRVLIGHNIPEEEIQSAPFPVKIVKLEMEVGSKKAVATPSMIATLENPNTAEEAKRIWQKYEDKARKELEKEKQENPDWHPSEEYIENRIKDKVRFDREYIKEEAAFLDKHKYTVILDAAPYLAVKHEKSFKWYLEEAPGREIYKKYPPVVDSSLEGSEMYLPFTSVAKAFGVPDSNIKWNGNALRMHWNKNMWVEFRSGSNYDMWYKGGKNKLEAPARVKNGVMMINSTDTYWTVLPARPFFDDGKLQPLLYAMPEPSDNGSETGKPYISCSFYDWIPLNEI